MNAARAVVARGDPLVLAPRSHLPRILCVDADRNGLAELRFHLRDSYRVEAVAGAGDALQLLIARPDFAVVLAGLRLSSMSGLRLLAEARYLAPHCVRLLLAGHSEVQAAIEALNAAQVFGVINKPYAPQQLTEALAAAVAQHRLLAGEHLAERQMLHAAVQALSELAGLGNPVAQAAASRVQTLALQLASQLGITDCWPLQLAPLLAPLAVSGLPPALQHKWQRGESLSAEEQLQATRQAQRVRLLLQGIPHIELALTLLQRSLAEPAVAGRALSTESREARRLTAQVRILKLATDYETLAAQGVPANLILTRLREAASPGQRRLHDALAGIRAVSETLREVRSLMLDQLDIGMEFAEDLRSVGNQLLIARGNAVSPGLIEQISHFRRGFAREPVRMLLAATGPD